MSSEAMKEILRERLVSPREASQYLNLPQYLLAHPQERKRLAMPHYRVGKLVRFKLSELMAWLERRQARQQAEPGGEGVDA